MHREPGPRHLVDTRGTLADGTVGMGKKSTMPFLTGTDPARLSANEVERPQIEGRSGFTISRHIGPASSSLAEASRANLE